MSSPTIVGLFFIKQDAWKRQKSQSKYRKQRAKPKKKIKNQDWKKKKKKKNSLQKIRYWY